MELWRHWISEKSSLQNTGFPESRSFRVSRFAARALEDKKTDIVADLDFMPEFTETQLESFFMSRIQMRPGKDDESVFLPESFMRNLRRCS